MGRCRKPCCRMSARHCSRSSSGETTSGFAVMTSATRDLMKRVVGENRDAHKTRVADVMTANPLVVSPDEDLEQCLALMRQHGFRHLPICQGRQLKGLVSLRDILLQTVVEKDGEVRMMRAYITQSS